MFTTVYSGIIGFLISLIILLKSAGWFTDSAEKVGKHFGIPQFIIGVTIVSIGTSLPELATSMFAIFNKSSEFVVGNVIGSNITNILLVIGFAAILSKKLVIKYAMEKVDLPVLIGSVFIAFIMIADGSIVLYEAIILLLAYCGYLWYLLSVKAGGKSKDGIQKTTYVILIASAIGVYIGAKYLVTAVQALSQIAGYTDTSILALSIVALGTSLPELFVSITAAKKKQYGMCVGNIVGSNIFNLFVVLGIPGLFGTLAVSASVISMLWIFIFATILLFVSAYTKEVTKYEGVLYILFYVLFLMKLFSLV